MLVDSFLDPFHQRSVLPRVGKSNLFINKKVRKRFWWAGIGGGEVFTSATKKTLRGSFWWPM